MLKLKPFRYFSYLIQRNNMTSPSIAAGPECNQHEGEGLSLEKIHLDSVPVISAWVWNEYRSEFPQSEMEAEELMKLPIPMAWLWCHYRGELQQTKEEKILADQLGRRDNVAVLFQRPANLYPTQVAASFAAGFIGATLLGQALAMSML